MDEKRVSVGRTSSRHEIDVRSNKTAEGVLHADAGDNVGTLILCLRLSWILSVGNFGGEP